MSYERIENCPICNKADFKNQMVLKDHTVSRESFVITKCNNCDFLFTNPRPDLQNIGKYYQSEEYISHSNTNKGIFNKIYQIVRKYTLKQKLALINNLSSKGTLLDYGCGTGHFLETCKKNGWKISGFEPNDAARKIAEEECGIMIPSNSLQTFEKESFDVVTLWHVLEHIHTLNETFAELLSLLKPNGHIIVAVPNVDSLDAQLYKEHWAAYDVPRHLYHFNQATMKKFLKKHKLNLVDTLPMKFDAYYVSLLSEKYKSGKSDYISSILSGYKSNLQAQKATNDYSSLIFVARKK